MSNSAGVGRLRRDGQPEPTAGPNERRAAILEMVMAAGSVKIEDLPDAFGASLMTVHRDLDTLPAEGLIRKTRGVATAMPSTRRRPAPSTGRGRTSRTSTRWPMRHCR